jgi:hypothetical protein
MNNEERSILNELDRIVQSNELRAQILPVIERVRGDLAAKPKSVMAWEAIPLAVYGDALPSAIRSSWIFILRRGTNTGPERHPNSHQRMMSFAGVGDMQVRTDPDSAWRSHILKNDPKEKLETRWISIPRNVWHQPVVMKEVDWVVVSFHTVPADELIEERPDPSSATGAKQMLYLDKDEG